MHSIKQTAILCCLSILPTTSLWADSIHQACTIMQDYAVMTFIEKQAGIKKYTEHQLELQSWMGDHPFYDIGKSVLEAAYQEQTASSDSQRVKNAISFGERQYQACLPKMQALETQINQSKNQGKPFTTVVAQCDYGCSIQELSIDAPLGVNAKSTSRDRVELLHYPSLPTTGYRLVAKLSNGKYCSAPIAIDPSKHTNIFVFNSSSCYLYRVQ